MVLRHMLVDVRGYLFGVDFVETFLMLKRERTSGGEVFVFCV
jgi:hypothetical protein